MRSNSPGKIIVIGGGIAGLSLAAEMADWAEVTVIEREPHLGYHASGRSAALFSETYGNRLVRALTLASRQAIADGGFAAHRRGALHVGWTGDDAAIDRLAGELQALVPSVRRLSAAELHALVPVIAREATCGGVYEPDAVDVDTGKMLAASASALKAGGGIIRTGEEVRAISPDGRGLRVETSAGVYSADIVVNAAGAWVDVVAGLAGLSGLGFQPKRRTAFLFDAPAGADISNWPLVVDLHEQFYFKPDAGRLIGSLADETDSEPCDAWPEDIDVAIAVDRIEQATSMRIGRPSTPWAGLRTFAPDRTPVAGFDPRLPGFFWLGGQGGYGFQVSLTLARMSAALIRGEPLPADVAALGVTAAALAPDRFLAPAATP
ncbi:FAD-binding oxidoreductase [bacterium M00.F.Ca.ET.141.01.1.1]|uniref:NAD(P)/FAD-dependent oxidoreductase n=1 Tax=unclassified Mesorhizobium TaxID=325217 RepID=UPI000FE76608|nr:MULTISPECIES: FAD-binding oxidoreductase [unclassified Mesorhizobium]RWC75159.1 MAG: FAD-binding oxidoreductase [Mesorhizobium sp.]TGQ86346.1 FAD-binding oxidoreductase [Mesorhizobium sp. M8A.F.Ca.ET.208.01.1.1]TGT47890.1 FAD-binding oxidoreductase [Mesorhizobium sp. M8A.F.Ca.ET.167.01.1.1]TGV51573.1 FAD-binding oxidoreductase [bacterium M00.F.Ca.ET.141.01.1.1]